MAMIIKPLRILRNCVPKFFSCPFRLCRKGTAKQVRVVYNM
jgi:hypothetical protein